MLVSTHGFWCRLFIAAVLLNMFSARSIASDIQSFDLDAGDADLILKQFAKQARLDIVYDPRSVEGIQTQEVVGMLSPKDALERMLEGTPLVFKEDLESGAFAVTRSEIPSLDQTTQNTEPQILEETEMNAKNNNWFKTLAAALTLGIAGGSEGLHAQDDDKIYEISPFIVQSEDTGYRAAHAISGTRVNVFLNSIPTNIGVLTEDFIKDNKFTIVDDAAKFAVGVEEAPSIFSNRFTIRGFSAGASRRNGVNLGEATPSTDTATISRIEIVKGPASVLYGVGGPGGVINYVTKKPLEVQRTSVETMVGTDSFFRTTFDSTGPIDKDKKFLYRFISTYNQWDWTAESGKFGQFVIAPSLTWNPTLKTSVRLSYENHSHPNNVTWREALPLVMGTTIPDPRNPANDLLLATGVFQGGSKDFIVDGPNSAWEFDRDLFEFEILHSFTLDFSARFFYRKDEFDAFRPVKYLSRTSQVFEDGQPTTKWPINSWNQSILGGSDTTQLDLSYKWATEKFNGTFVAGGSNSENDRDEERFNGVGTSIIDITNPQPIDRIIGVTSIPNPHGYGQAAGPDNTLPLMTPCCPGDATGKSSALWAIANVQTFGDRLNILAGVRKDTSDRLTRNGNVTLENVSYNTSQAGFTFKLFDGNDDGGFLDEAVFSYGYSESVQPNNFFVNSPQEGSGDEFGIRLEAMDGKIAASLSYFDIQLSSIERTDFTDRDPVTGEPRRTLGGSEASDGLEFELYLAPVEGLDIVFNYADYDPRVVSNPSDPQTIGNPTSGAIQGAINSFARYTLQEGPGKGLYFQGTYQQRDDIHPYGSIRNQYLVILPSYDIVAASIGYMMNIRDIYWTFDLTAKNLFDKHYLTKNVNQGEGRRILGSVSVEF